MKSRLLAALCASTLLVACEARIGRDEEEKTASTDNATAAAEISAEGKAEEGQFSINAPGFGLKFNIPEGMREHAETDGDILYPGAELTGMHIEAGETAEGQGDGAVELRFTSTEAPDLIATWYRDPARAGDITVTSIKQEGDGFVVEGMQKDDKDPFKVRLAPRAGGGTDGRLILRDHG